MQNFHGGFISVLFWWHNLNSNKNLISLVLIILNYKSLEKKIIHKIKKNLTFCGNVG